MEHIDQFQRERISSSMTVFFKIVLTLGLMPLASILIAFLFAPFSDDNSNLGGILLVVVLLFVPFVMYRYFLQFKKVELTESSIIISNYHRSIEVLFCEIEAVSGSILFSPELVWIRFRHPTEFGQKVVFMATLRFFRGWSVHPIVPRLRNLISNT